jgi:DNA-binding MarR family transcriptional regulator
VAKNDAVDDLVNQWAALRPDLDVQPMALFARCNRFVSRGMRSLESALATQGLSVGEFDVLSALFRSGDPHVLRPSELADRVMVTRAGITARVDRLVERDLVRRQRDADDRRSEPVQLTDAGRLLLNGALSGVLEAEAALFDGLTQAQKRQLDTLLRLLT